MEIGPDGKPCRACVSVEDMMKKGREMAEKIKKKGDFPRFPEQKISIILVLCRIRDDAEHEHRSEVARMSSRQG